ncbi:MAG: RNA methyltransferase, partial [Desulfamplus sp.]|nr:RNA methyltransferase [Desulfamplus sp.]
IAGFKAENFRTFEKHIAEIEWELYLKRDSIIQCQVSTSLSRLYHTDALARRADLAIMEHLGRYPVSRKVPLDNLALWPGDLASPAGDLASPPGDSGYMPVDSAPQTVMIRGDNDRFQISIDSSGNLLHKRGIKTVSGRAPLRETLAFGLLAALGYSGNTTLVDGMCGSGSFPLEAAMISCNIPPGYFRTFAFEGWPCFSPPAWNHMKKNICPELLPPLQRGEIKTIFASDIDADMVNALGKTLHDHNLSPPVQVMQQDFFGMEPVKISREPGIVVLNPPYGRRMGEPRAVTSLFKDIGKKLKSDFKGWKAGVIIPDKILAGHLPGSVKLIPLRHGGLDVHGAIFVIP